jgi:hypothetical protein
MAVPVLAIVGAAVSLGGMIAGLVSGKKGDPEYSSPLLGLPDVLTYLAGSDKFEMALVERVFSVNEEPFAVDLTVNYPDGYPGVSPPPKLGASARAAAAASFSASLEHWRSSSIESYILAHNRSVKLYHDQSAGLLESRFGVKTYANKYAVFQNVMPVRVGVYVQTQLSGSFNISTNLSIAIESFYGGQQINLADFHNELDNLKFIRWFLHQFGATEMQISQVLSVVSGNNPGEYGVTNMSSSDQEMFSNIAHKLANGFELTAAEKEFYSLYNYLFEGSSDPLSDEEKQVISDSGKKAEEEQEKSDNELSGEWYKNPLYIIIGVLLLVLILRK